MAFQLQGRNTDAVDALEAQPLPRDSNNRVSTWDRVKNVVWIKQNSVYHEALEDWDREIKVKGERLVRREKRSDELTNEIYNVVGFFSVFQGVILTAVSQLAQSSSSSSQSGSSAIGCKCSRPLCGKVWFPILLSGLAALAAVIGIGLKFRDIHRVKVLLIKERREQSLVIRRESQLRQLGEKFRFKGLKDPPKLDLLKTHSFVKAAGLIVAIIVFTVVFILSYIVILCDKLVIKGWD